MQIGCNDNDTDVLYKDVVIVGNGPSGICLSYMLAGNWPYYTGEPHPGDDMLTARLHFSTLTSSNECEEKDNPAAEENRRQSSKCANRSQCSSLSHGRGLARSTRRKLECLSSGIEGRGGGRPLALLMDQLQHPCVDAGLDLPSLLTWRSVKDHPEHRIIEHVVLGKGLPGGAWQSMDPNVLTISLSRWMSLPGLDLRHWEMLVDRGDSTGCWHAAQEKIQGACKTASRISVGTVAAYYKDYVRWQGLEEYFRCGTTVTSVRPTMTSVRPTMHSPNVNEEDFGWIVEGFENKTGAPFRYRCRKAVLATGTTDLCNHLGLPDENSQSSWITHDLNDLEARLDKLVSQCGESLLNGQVDPVLVIGAGLSAADAIMAARFRGIPVLHAFRDSSNDWSKKTTPKIHNYDRLQWLPSSIYPEYHKVYEMMADGGTNYPLYKSLPGYTVVSLGASNGAECRIDNQRTVVLSSPFGQLETFRVSIAAILIGYKADLSYLENHGIGLGNNSEKPIDNKSNPIQIDDFTYEVVKAPRRGLYALGPLVGDNFVRFILGGAFGILAHILSTSAT